jgi:hypothetical protein
MTPPKKPWTWCNNGPDCETQLIFASRNGRLVPYEYADRPPFSDSAVGCHVLIDGIALTPREAIEHFQTRGEGRSEDAARELVSGYPFHRPHYCERPGTDAGDKEPS